MKRSYIIIATLVLLVIIVGSLLVQSQRAANRSITQSNGTNNTASSKTNESTATNTATLSAVPPSQKAFAITASNYKFDPTQLTVKKGDVVAITVRSSQGNHDFVIDELNVKSKQFNAGQQEVVTFTANKVGTFEYYCSVGNHRAMGMKGTLTVVE